MHRWVADEGSSLLARAMLAGSALFWAGNFVVGRGLRAELSPIALTFWRWTVALLILLPLAWGPLRRHRHALRQSWRLVAALGLTGVAGFQSLVYLALRTTPATNALLFLTLAPVSIVLVSWLIFGERVSGRQVAGILLSLLGAVWLVARGDAAALRAMAFHRGDLWMLLAVLLWAIYSVLLKRRPPDLPQVVLLSGSILAGLAVLLPLYLAALATGDQIRLSPTTLLGILYVALFASVLAFLFWNHGVSRIGANRAGLFLHLMPLFGALLAFLFLGEGIFLYHLAGALLVFGGLAVMSTGGAPG